VSSRIKTTAEQKADPERFDPLALYHHLYKLYGPSRWWPGDTPFEIALGAVLTQNTAWTNVEKAICNLKSAGMLDIRKLHTADSDRIASLIKPSGYYNIKTKRLKNFISLVMECSSGDLDAFFSQDLKQLRSLLLGVNGIGKETADSICCYAANRDVFVVDAYTKRMLLRHNIIDSDWDYDDIQNVFHAGLPKRLDVYKDLHAYIVFIGKDCCKARNPQCDACPLKSWSL
jgi:endonuclease-3 related protein